MHNATPARARTQLLADDPTARVEPLKEEPAAPFATEVLHARVGAEMSQRLSTIQWQIICKNMFHHHTRKVFCFWVKFQRYCILH
jgi:hypothetical protein